MVFKPTSSAEMLPEYSLVINNRYYEEVGFLTVYGIKANFMNKEKIIRDISSDESSVKNLIALLKGNKVEFCHFESVIEDVVFSENIE